MTDKAMRDAAMTQPAPVVREWRRSKRTDNVQAGPNDYLTIQHMVDEHNAVAAAIRALRAEVEALTEKLNAEFKRSFATEAAKRAAEAEAAALRSAVEHVRAIIVEGAMEGFNPKVGDWAERLFASQGVTKAALKPRK